jgi:hypothetical protein
LDGGRYADAIRSGIFKPPDWMMMMRKSWTSLFAAAALAIIVLVMVVQFAPSVLGAAMAVTDFG